MAHGLARINTDFFLKLKVLIRENQWKSVGNVYII
jgi:hypothetical protein